eukprot:TRINITY_DN1835_c1_g1_i1.p1 TRINITY_DN1835_c1_g1~~TRINITY_DN1835_c1_g1_i1.p1  ORF type:complete len:2214 (-),score=423.31 TRINITY_DN1835_c1_g1_i1:102-6743(-)
MVAARYGPLRQTAAEDEPRRGIDQPAAVLLAADATEAVALAARPRRLLARSVFVSALAALALSLTALAVASFVQAASRRGAARPLLQRSASDTGSAHGDASGHGTEDAGVDSADLLEQGVLLDLSRATLLSNNLGGQGPRHGEARELRYGRAATLDSTGEDIDLVVTAASTYSPRSPMKNGVRGSYGTINLAYGTSVDLWFNFASSVSGDPVTLEIVYWTFYDLDEPPGRGVNEEIMIRGYQQYRLVDHSQVKVKKNVSKDGATQFVSTAFGWEGDNPDDPGTTTNAQRQRSVPLLFTNMSKFQVTFRVEAPKAMRSYGGRNFLFIGSSPQFRGSGHLRTSISAKADATKLAHNAYLKAHSEKLAALTAKQEAHKEMLRAIAEESASNATAKRSDEVLQSAKATLEEAKEKKLRADVEMKHAIAEEHELQKANVSSLRSSLRIAQEKQAAAEAAKSETEQKLARSVADEVALNRSVSWLTHQAAVAHSRAQHGSDTLEKARKQWNDAQREKEEANNDIAHALRQNDSSLQQEQVVAHAEGANATRLQQQRYIQTLKRAEQKSVAKTTTRYGDDALQSANNALKMATSEREHADQELDDAKRKEDALRVRLANVIKREAGVNATYALGRKFLEAARMAFERSNATMLQAEQERLAAEQEMSNAKASKASAEEKERAWLQAEQQKAHVEAEMTEIASLEQALRAREIEISERERLANHTASHGREALRKASVSLQQAERERKQASLVEAKTKAAEKELVAAKAELIRREREQNATKLQYSEKLREALWRLAAANAKQDEVNKTIERAKVHEQELLARSHKIETQERLAKHMLWSAQAASDKARMERQAADMNAKRAQDLKAKLEEREIELREKERDANATIARGSQVLQDAWQKVAAAARARDDADKEMQFALAKEKVATSLRSRGREAMRSSKEALAKASAAQARADHELELAEAKEKSLQKRVAEVTARERLANETLARGSQALRQAELEEREAEEERRDAAERMARAQARESAANETAARGRKGLASADAELREASARRKEVAAREAAVAASRHEAELEANRTRARAAELLREAQREADAAKRAKAKADLELSQTIQRESALEARESEVSKASEMANTTLSQAQLKMREAQMKATAAEEQQANARQQIAIAIAKEAAYNAAASRTAQQVRTAHSGMQNALSEVDHAWNALKEARQQESEARSQKADADSALARAAEQVEVARKHATLLEAKQKEANETSQHGQEALKSAHEAFERAAAAKKDADEQVSRAIAKENALESRAADLAQVGRSANLTSERGRQALLEAARREAEAQKASRQANERMARAAAKEAALNASWAHEAELAQAANATAKRGMLKLQLAEKKLQQAEKETAQAEEVMAHAKAKEALLALRASKLLEKERLVNATALQSKNTLRNATETFAHAREERERADEELQRAIAERAALKSRAVEVLRKQNAMNVTSLQASKALASAEAQVQAAQIKQAKADEEMARAVAREKELQNEALKMEQERKVANSTKIRGLDALAAAQAALERAEERRKEAQEKWARATAAEERTKAVSLELARQQSIANLTLQRGTEELRLARSKVEAAESARERADSEAARAEADEEWVRLEEQNINATRKRAEAALRDARSALRKAQQERERADEQIANTIADEAKRTTDRKNTLGIPTAVESSTLMPALPPSTTMGPIAPVATISMTTAALPTTTTTTSTSTSTSTTITSVVRSKTVTGVIELRTSNPDVLQHNARVTDAVQHAVANMAGVNSGSVALSLEPASSVARRLQIQGLLHASYAIPLQNVAAAERAVLGLEGPSNEAATQEICDQLLRSGEPSCGVTVLSKRASLATVNDGDITPPATSEAAHEEDDTQHSQQFGIHLPPWLLMLCFLPLLIGCYARRSPGTSATPSAAATRQPNRGVRPSDVVSGDAAILEYITRDLVGRGGQLPELDASGVALPPSPRRPPPGGARWLDDPPPPPTFGSAYPSAAGVDAVRAPAQQRSLSPGGGFLADPDLEAPEARNAGLAHAAGGFFAPDLDPFEARHAGLAHAAVPHAPSAAMALASRAASFPPQRSLSPARAAASATAARFPRAASALERPSSSDGFVRPARLAAASSSFPCAAEPMTSLASAQPLPAAQPYTVSAPPPTVAALPTAVLVPVPRLLQPPSPPSQALGVYAPAAPVLSGERCWNCGNMYMIDSLYCRKCGVQRR